MKTTVKIKYRSSSRNNDDGVLMLLVTHRRISSAITSPYRLKSKEWDKWRQSVIIKEDLPPQRVLELKKIQRQIDKDVREINRIVEQCRMQGEYTSSEIISRFRNRKQFVGLKNFMEKRILDLHNQGKFGTEHAYRNSMNSFMRFTDNKDVRLDKLDALLLRRYELFLKSRGNSMNTISCYMRSLRAIYNYAISEHIIRRKPENPFLAVFTGNMVTEKRAITKDDIKKIDELKLQTREDCLKLSKSLFLFSFYTRGMSYKDMIFLKKTDITGKTIRYQRQKTGQLIEVQLLPCIQSIMDEYKSQTQGSGYVFPILSDVKDKVISWKQYQAGLSVHNRNLKRIASLTGLRKNLTSYVARHSWATIARREGIPISIISRGMGHESEKTTRIYIERLDNTDIDRANKKILTWFYKNSGENLGNFY